MKRLEHRACFGGWQDVYQHESKTLGCLMNFGIYFPRTAQTKKLPVLYWLSGLTCNEQNFITKAGAQRYADEHQVILVSPDTSPRGEDIPNDNAYDLGMGAGFYINATQEPWAKNFKMYDYIVHELPTFIESNFSVGEKRGISGHSMGGHGALMIALKNPDRYQSVSAFSPIVAPSQVPWGQKAFTAYLGNNQEAWKAYDTVELISQSSKKMPILVDQGTGDEFLANQLKPELLKSACEKSGHPLTLNMREGYDHSYYFISTFIGEHVRHHAKYLATILMFLFVSVTETYAKECFLIKEKDKVIKTDGDCSIAFAPNSTFKIPLALMGFDSKILTSETEPSFPFKAEYAPKINVCKGDHNPKTWMRDSCVWFSQVLTTKMGMEKFRNYVKSFNYGNKDISGGLTTSWLSSSIQITADQQIQFLQNMIDNKFSVSPKAYEMTKNILYIQELPGGWNLYGKTGNGMNKDNLQQGWFVGWIEKGDRKLVFAHHIADEAVQKSYASFRSKNEAMIKLWYVIDSLE